MGRPPRWLKKTSQQKQPRELSREEILENWGNRVWRLNNLYWILDKYGREVKFQMNYAQRTILPLLWYLNLILKARQLGFTTLICILFLDACLFNSNVRAGIIAHNREDANSFFDDKVDFAYQRLPDIVKEAITAETDKAGMLKFSNGSSIRVSTSFRSGTLQFLHISEFGKICAKYPKKAKEIVTGALNAVAAGCHVFIESTAEGRSGYFWDYCETARKLQASGARLTKLDYKFFFFAWWQDPSYTIDPTGVILSTENKDYFDELEFKHGINLTPGQKAWYVKKLETQGDDMKQEFPSTPDEAFEIAVQGAYYRTELIQVRKQKRLGAFPYDPRYPVNTFWDLGISDHTSIWFHQDVAGKQVFIRYFAFSDRGLGFYVNYLKETGYTFGIHFFPHDMAKREMGSQENPKSLIDTFRSLLPGHDTYIVPRVADIASGIQAVRNVLPVCYFDAENCDEGIKGLENYRRRWDDNNGCWMNAPVHDWASHPEAAFRQYAMGYAAPSEGKTGWRPKRR